MKKQHISVILNMFTNDSTNDKAAMVRQINLCAQSEQVRYRPAVVLVNLRDVLINFKLLLR